MLNTDGDWIAIDRQDYVRRGVRFARDLANLSNTRQTLRQRVTRIAAVRWSIASPKIFNSVVWGMWEDKFKVESGRRLIGKSLNQDGYINHSELEKSYRHKQTLTRCLKCFLWERAQSLSGIVFPC